MQTNNPEPAPPSLLLQVSFLVSASFSKCYSPALSTPGPVIRLNKGCLDSQSPLKLLKLANSKPEYLASPLPSTETTAASWSGFPFTPSASWLTWCPHVALCGRSAPSSWDLWVTHHHFNGNWILMLASLYLSNSKTYFLASVTLQLPAFCECFPFTQGWWHNLQGPGQNEDVELLFQKGGKMYH